VLARLACRGKISKAVMTSAMSRWKRSSGLIGGVVRRFLKFGGLSVALTAASILLFDAPRVDAAGTPQQLVGELIIFPDVTAQRAFDSTVSDNSEVVPAGSVFLTAKFASLRFLVEGFLSSDEQELERAQLGLHLNEELVAWAGRFHNPIGYWNATFHHGSFLQTSISRPVIVAFEDDGGVLPMHVTGLLLQGEHGLGEGALAYEAGFGLGPEFSSDDVLEPLDILEPNAGKHEFSSALKLAFRPDSLDDDEIAAFFGYADIPGAGSRADVTQVLGGAYVVWTPRYLRVLAAGFYVDNDFDSGTGASDASFVSGYVQAEVVPIEEITAYVRIEASGGVGGDDYLELFPEVVRGRTVAGVRFDIGERQAVKFEFGDTRRSGRDGEEVLIQWSAAFP